MSIIALLIMVLTCVSWATMPIAPAISTCIILFLTITGLGAASEYKSKSEAWALNYSSFCFTYLAAMTITLMLIALANIERWP